jgi:predicted HTH domain antitoxin
MDVNLRIPENIYLAMKVPDKQKKEVIIRELALSLYEQEILSFGKARDLAKMSKWEFHELLGSRRIERHYNIADLKEDMDYGKE